MTGAPLVANGVVITGVAGSNSAHAATSRATMPRRASAWAALHRAASGRARCETGPTTRPRRAAAAPDHELLRSRFDLVYCVGSPSP
jgi:hypothetical protein